MNVPKNRQILMLTIAKHPFHSVVAQDFLAELYGNDPMNTYKLHIIGLTEVDKDEARIRLMSFLKQGSATIVPVGQRCSVFAKEILDELGGCPTVFIGVKDPIKLGLVESLEKPNSYMSGVIRKSPESLALAEKLLFLAPYINKIIIPYWAYGEGGHLAQQVVAMKLFLTVKGFHVEAIPIENKRQAIMVTKQYADKRTCVVFLEGCISVEALREAAHICWKQRALLCTDSRWGILLGASCAFGGSLGAFSVEALKIIHQHHVQGISLSQLPVTVLEDNSFLEVNPNSFRMIGMPEDIIEQFCNQLDVEVNNRWIGPPDILSSLESLPC